MSYCSALLFSCIFLSLPKNSAAQLAGTKWVGTFTLSKEVSCYLEFTKDALNQALITNDEVIEVMKYEIRNDTLMFSKLQGGSPCSTEEKGVYIFKVKDTMLQLTMVFDDCEARTYAGFDRPMTRVTGSIKTN